MRILLDYRPALRQRTGVGEYVYELALALLAGAGPHPDMLTLFSSSWRDRVDRATVPGAAVTDLRIPVRALNYAWHRAQWPPVEWLTGARYDVVHAAHPIRIPSRTAAQVVTVHDLDFLRHPERTRGEIRRDYPALAPAHIRAADAVLAVSAHTASEIETLTGRPAASIDIAPLGRPAWPRRLDEPRDGVLLFLGTLEPRKNVAGLLDAYERLLAHRQGAGLSTPRLVLAGGHGPGADTLLARALAGPLAGHVEVTGYIDPDRRVDTYRRALALIMPSHTEGFGLPALEAMTVGVPVVAANRGALPEVLGGAGLLCDASDADALCVSMAQVIDDPRRRASVAGAAMSDRPLTIGVDARELAGQPTGVGRYVAGVLQAWADTGLPHRLRLFAHAPPPSWITALPLDLTVSIAPAEVAGTWWEQTVLPAAARRSRVDVLLAPAYTAPLRAPCPTVLIVHDVSFCAQPGGFRWREGLRRRVLTRLSARRAAAVLTDSAFSADEISRWLGVPRAGVILAPQGAPLWRGGPPVEARDPLVLSVGTLFTRRHLPELLQAFAGVVARVPDARLALVGANHTHPRIDPLVIAAQLGVQDRVSWQPYVDEATLDRLYGSARVFAFLSDYEGFGMTPMEAGARGVPSVMLDTPVAREVYADGATLVPLSVPAIKDALVTLMLDATAHTRAVDAVRRRLPHFTWNHTAEVVRTALERAANTEGRT